MNGIIGIFSVAICTWMLAPTAQAKACGWHSLRSCWGRGACNYKSKTSSHSVPKLDPSGTGSAMLLLLGGMAYVTSRRGQDDLT